MNHKTEQEVFPAVVNKQQTVIIAFYEHPKTSLIHKVIGPFDNHADAMSYALNKNIKHYSISKLHTAQCDEEGNWL